jgi:peptide/nickel transport system permease protein
MGGPAVAVDAVREPALDWRRGRPWVRFLVRRGLGLTAVLAAVTVCVFLMLQLVPGDPVISALGIDASPAEMAQVRSDLGLDEPLAQQFADWVSGIFQGDLGEGFSTHQPVTQLIGDRIATSLKLAGGGILIVMLFSVPLGLVAAALTRDDEHPKLEMLFTATTSAVGALPEFLTGTVLAYIFAVELGWLPVAGASGWESFILPALAVAIAPLATLARIVRMETLDVLAQDYIRTARSKRLPPRRLLFRHVLPNVLTAALTIGGLIFASIIGSAVVVENVFALPGLGTALVDAVLANDYPIVQGITLVLAVAVVLVNAAVDVILALIDPRTLSRES